MTYLDTWRSGTFLLYNCKAAFWIQETVWCRALSCSTVCAVALAYLRFSKNVPHTSRYIIARDSVLPGLPLR